MLIGSKRRAIALALIVATALIATTGMAQAAMPSAQGSPSDLAQARQAVKLARQKQATAVKAVTTRQSLIVQFQESQIQALEDSLDVRFTLPDLTADASSKSEVYIGTVNAFGTAAAAYGQAQAATLAATSALADANTQYATTQTALATATANLNTAGPILGDAKEAFRIEDQSWAVCIDQLTQYYCFNTSDVSTGGLLNEKLQALRVARDLAQSRYDQAEYVHGLYQQSSQDWAEKVNAATTAQATAVQAEAEALKTQDSALTAQKQAFSDKAIADAALTQGKSNLDTIRSSIHNLKASVAQAQTDLVADNTSLAKANSQFSGALRKLRRLQH